MFRALLLSLVLALGLVADEPRWFRGNTHCHSFWSDGDQFPELVALWYKEHGYDFLAMSDHNVLMEGERWVPMVSKRRTIDPKLLDDCRQAYGDDWVALRGEDDKQEVQLKTYAEISGRLNETDRFLMIQGEEITGHCQSVQVHVNAINLEKLIRPQPGDTVLECLFGDLRDVRAHQDEVKHPVIAHVNHPNWKWWDVRDGDLAACGATHFELCNNTAGSNNMGNGDLPSSDRVWDIANTIRLADMHRPPIFGVGTDDAHNYHVFEPGRANPGRAWIMVRAETLETNAIMTAIRDGQFYVSTGVRLADVRFADGTLDVSILPDEGATYTIEFIGTPRTYDRTVTQIEVADSKGVVRPPMKCYSAEVGQVFQRSEGTQASYRLTGEELFVRARITSSRRMPDPAANQVQEERAWTQPVGWQTYLDTLKPKLADPKK